MRKTICDLCGEEIEAPHEETVTVTIEHKYCVADEEYHFHNQCGIKVRNNIFEFVKGYGKNV